MRHYNYMRSFQEMLDENRRSYSVRDMESIGKSGRGVGNYTKMDKARIVSARARMLSFGAPCLAKDIPEGMLDPIDLAMLEWDQGVCPIELGPTYAQTKREFNPDTGRGEIVTREMPSVDRRFTQNLKGTGKTVDDEIKALMAKYGLSSGDDATAPSDPENAGGE